MKNNLIKKFIDINVFQCVDSRYFTWTSGLKSPIYTDNRIILSNIEARNLVIDCFVNEIKKVFKEDDFNVVMGIATAGIGLGALLSYKLNKPFVYIRANKKKHGKAKLIEGILPENPKILLIDDVLATSKTTSNVIKKLKNEYNLNVMATLFVFSYNIPSANNFFKKLNIKLLTLFTIQDFIKYSEKNNYLNKTQKNVLKNFLYDIYK